ncbi:MAG: Outer membrane porin F precursor [Bacteroidetes bacterium ADurb.Bin041]|nr:MAG: Outer membrane porin F precursor [Bacteroidetes bacterium ADurb.Bin041]
MKKFLLIVLIGLSVTLFGQTTDRPWLIGISSNYADFNAVEMSVRRQLRDANWMGKTLPSQLKVARSLSKSFVFGAEFSFVTLESEKLNLIPTIKSNVSTDKFWRMGGQFEYKFANGYLLKEDAIFDPYIFLGLNGSNISEKTYLAQSTGAGTNIWFNKWLGLNFEGSYDYLFDFNDYFHYSFGVTFRLGKAKDSDGDGVPDHLDECPDVPGLKILNGCPDRDGDGIPDHLDECPDVPGLAEFKGCPDRDGDGIPDHLDECPDVPGLAQFKGCPDRDGDGVPDHLDECPDVPGLAEFKGCPDRDGDGIPDHLDECPDVPGLARFKGCPDRDGDGIPDHLDECPDEFGTITNKGCPEIIQEVEKIDFHAKHILFEISSSKIKQESFSDLDEIIAIMKKFPDSRFTIHGHTDNTGSDALNMNLSKNRAKSVKDYFISKGINASRLESDGFGKNKPIDVNDTPEGRANNRRVEIKVIK